MITAIVTAYLNSDKIKKYLDKKKNSGGKIEGPGATVATEKSASKVVNADIEAGSST